MSSGANVYRLTQEAKGVSVGNLNAQTVADLKKLDADWQKPNLLDVVAREVFFADDVIFLEGQEDVGLLKNYSESRGLPSFSVLSGAPFGYRFIRKTDQSTAYYQIDDEQALHLFDRWQVAHKSATASLATAQTRPRAPVRDSDKLAVATSHVPALLLGGREEGSDEREVHRAFGRAKAAGDFLPQLHHAPVALGLIVGEGHRRIVKKAQRVLARQAIRSASATRAKASMIRRERRESRPDPRLHA